MFVIKPLTSFILAVACFVLAGVLAFGGRKANRAPSARVKISQPQPAFISDDLAVLDRPVGGMKFAAVSLQDAISRLIEQTHANIMADWQALEQVGVLRSRPITVSIKKTTLGNALATVLTALQMPKPASVPAFYISDGVITITTAEEAGHHTQLAMFNIRGLVDELITYDSTGGHAIPQMMSLGPPTSATQSVTSREETVDQITKCITDIVSPDLWKDAGGTVASIREINGILVVEQTTYNLRLISILLQRLDEGARSQGIPRNIVEVSQLSLGTSDAMAAFFNIVTVKSALHASQPPATDPTTRPAVADADETAVDAAIGSVDHDSWALNGGSGLREYIGNVLVVVQKPANIEPVRAALVKLQSTSARSETHPTSAPKGAN